MKMRFKQTGVSTGILLLMLVFSHSQYMLTFWIMPYRHSNNQIKTRVFRKLDAILSLPSQPKMSEISSSNNCLQFQHYITKLIKAHHPDSTKLLRNKHLFKSTRADAETNATDCYSDLSLKLFQPGLYARAKMVFSNYTCYNKHTVKPDYRDLLIYSPYHTGLNSTDGIHSYDPELHSTNNTYHTDIHSPGQMGVMSASQIDNTHSKTRSDDVIKPNVTDVDLVLLTSMYHSTEKQYLFINTVINWSNLTAPSRVQPVLFLTHMDIVEKSGILLYLAYLRGWIIAVAPDCLKSRYPLLHSMFHFGRAVVSNADWYGFANADIQFTPGLMKTISEINQYNGQVNNTGKPIVFISSKRTDVYVPRGQLYTNPDDMITLSQGHKPRNGFAVDLFVYHRNSTKLLKKMPRFAVGRRGFDNWLIYDVLQRHLGSVDITRTSPMVHLGINDLNLHQNSHHTRTKDSDYNIHIIKAIKSKNWQKDVGKIDTVSQLERNRGSAGGWDLYRQWLGNGRYVKFILKSRDGKKIYLSQKK